MIYAEAEFIERVANAVSINRNVVFLLGAGVSLPDGSGFGVPGTEAIVETIKNRLGKNFMPTSSYQDAFDQIIRKMGQDTANDVIRESVARARKDADAVITGLGKKQYVDIEQLELENDKWHIPAGIFSIASLCAHFPKSFGRTVLTTNFDPLIEIALSRQRTPWFSNALHADGSLLYLRGVGTHVVHLHGHWWGSDTLHTPIQLLAKRPQLMASIEKLLENSTIVVVGYSGWQDVFMTTLKNILEKNSTNVDILWGFYEADVEKIMTNYSHVLETLKPGLGRRSWLYSGVSANSTLPQLFDKIVSEKPAEDMSTFLSRVEMARSGFVRYSGLGKPWGNVDSSLGDYLKLLTLIDERKAIEAALFAVEYLLPDLERQPVHSTPVNSDLKWIREAIEKCKLLIGGTVTYRVWLEGAVIDMNNAPQKDTSLTSKDKTTLMAASDAVCACLAYTASSKRYSPVCYMSVEDSWPVSALVAKSIHAAARTVHDDDSALWGYLTRRLLGGNDHLNRFRN